ncbi:MAG: GxxExxY protein [Planctomycetota bacterium]
MREKRPEPPPRVDELARQVIGAAIEVHRHLGAGFKEAVYEEALAFELAQRQVPFERQAVVQLLYKNHPVGDGRLDLLVGGELIVELKAVDAMLPIFSTQVINYLRATGHPLALLINFNHKVLKDGIERFV